MEFDEAAAARLEDVYLGPDIVAQRQDTLRRLNIQPGEHVLDIGSGPGFLAEDIARLTGPKGRVLGVDLSTQLIARATARASCEWLAYREADATDLPFDDASFDVVVSTQVAEYVPDITAFCAELARVLRPGGRALVMATDWESVVWHSSDPARMARILAAFEPHCANSRLPRTLRPHLNRAGLSDVSVSVFPIVTLDRFGGAYSAMIVPLITAYIRENGTISDAELKDWADDLDNLDARGEHFFASTRFSFACRKPV